MRKLRWIVLPLIASVALTIEASSTPDSGLFESSVPLEIRIQAPWRQLTRGMEAGESADGRLVYETQTGDESELWVRVTTRGISRLDVCEFPLLTLEFRPEETSASPFSDQPIVHLTPQCRNQSGFQDNLIQEYLSYQAYRLLEEPALGVRLAVVDYLDTNGGRPPRPALAFLVEDLNQAAARGGGEWLERETVEIRSLSPETLALFGLFQYMLGNTDWSVLRGPPGEACCHNVGILGQAVTAPQLMPLPFDLDSTGLVDPPYAAPAADLPIRTVRQRLYRGFCESNSYMPLAIARFQAQRAELVDLFEDDPLLSRAAQRRTRKYLDSFFEILDDPKKVQKQIFDDCR